MYVTIFVEIGSIFPKRWTICFHAGERSFDTRRTVTQITWPAQAVF